MKLWYVEVVMCDKDQMLDAPVIVAAKGVIEAGVKAEKLAIDHYDVDEVEWGIAEEIETHEELEGLVEFLGDELIFEPGLFEEKGA